MDLRAFSCRKTISVNLVEAQLCGYVEQKKTNEKKSPGWSLLLITRGVTVKVWVAWASESSGIKEKKWGMTNNLWLETAGMKPVRGWLQWEWWETRRTQSSLINGFRHLYRCILDTLILILHLLGLLFLRIPTLWCYKTFTLCFKKVTAELLNWTD